VAAAIKEEDLDSNPFPFKELKDFSGTKRPFLMVTTGTNDLSVSSNWTFSSRDASETDVVETDEKEAKDSCRARATAPEASPMPLASL
jgi:hypothetical protein